VADKWWDDYNGFGAEDSWEIIKCKGCGDVSFLHNNWFSEDMNDEGFIPPTTRIYPMRGKDILTAKGFYNLEPSVRNIYKETIDCFNNKALVLCAVGIRAIVEGICKIEKVVSGTIPGDKQRISRGLDGKIYGLVEKGVITRKHADFLHALRFLGNKAVHELMQPSTTELKLSIDIIENMIENLYELDSKISDLNRARRLRNNAD
jgi:hypothetical protein